MAQFTLLGLNNHINYLIERGSLEELLEFLGMGYSKAEKLKIISLSF